MKILYIWAFLITTQVFASIIDDFETLPINTKLEFLESARFGEQEDSKTYIYKKIWFKSLQGISIACSMRVVEALSSSNLFIPIGTVAKVVKVKSGINFSQQSHNSKDIYRLNLAVDTVSGIRPIEISCKRTNHQAGSSKFTVSELFDVIPILQLK